MGYREFWHRKNEWMGLDYWRCGNINEGPERCAKERKEYMYCSEILRDVGTKMRAPRTER